MLLPLLQRYASQMRVSLYHTPDLRGLLRLLMPQRFNETIGVQHIKVYLFDDSVIISGWADLSLTHSLTHSLIPNSQTQLSFFLITFFVFYRLCTPSPPRANLSDSYFTNRQDRYVLLENCKEVADFFASLVGAVGDVSLQLHPDDSVSMLEGRVHPYNGERVCACARACVRACRG